MKPKLPYAVRAGEVIVYKEGRLTHERLYSVVPFFGQKDPDIVAVRHTKAEAGLVARNLAEKEAFDARCAKAAA